jgi:hypothetical protein
LQTFNKGLWVEEALGKKMISTDDLQIDLSFWSKEDENRLRTLKLLLSVYSNNCIAA